MKVFVTLSLLTSLLFTTSCSKMNDGDSTTIVARVENEILTEAEVKLNLGEKATKKQQKEYVQRWLDRELLYQAAKDVKMDRSPHYQEKIFEAERNLLSMAYLNTIIKSEKQEITEADIHSYFIENREKYLRTDDVIRYATYTVSSASSAWNVRKGLSKNNFYSSAKLFSKAPVIPESKISFVKRSSLSRSLQKELFAIKSGGITTPLKNGKDMSLYLVIEKGNAGERATLEEVESDVRNQLITSLYQTQVNEAMANLRSESNYTFNREYFEPAKDGMVSLRGKKDE